MPVINKLKLAFIKTQGNIDIGNETILYNFIILEGGETIGKIGPEIRKLWSSKVRFNAKMKYYDR